MYRCAKCKERVMGDINNVGIQCTVCGSKMFYKERPNVKKEIKNQ
ncbi:MAG: DNA-directed RNA polymerase subunit P [Candidatus Thermoplasmatota archaeon]|nr:DNA-directed RNA polymerase subunit P [Euryarchaeota archaeon]MBU4031432.1 DNA-directed RNA polymerase subunit P [Candidatus Thermoplasmatota archaeon]MBU4071097.1 DNA-directed RNA polymerase subunit P [Candidatus Thermoplasmatota archaeon]MBU4144979.1 DNA-directed RNA polymerase subunit P [Candidatus Thermoplasmatota archaeon]MBU4591115.1 DNA-directed RNA polymerase subunit P [Candidatus Thermoplasmatota archaeon]